jgi:hypothetical protein
VPGVPGASAFLLVDPDKVLGVPISAIRTWLTVEGIIDGVGYCMREIANFLETAPRNVQNEIDLMFEDTYRKLYAAKCEKGSAAETRARLQFLSGCSHLLQALTENRLWDVHKCFQEMVYKNNPVSQ